MRFKFIPLRTGGRDNYGMIKKAKDINEEAFYVDKNGVPIPTQVRRYPFADEFTYRI